MLSSSGAFHVINVLYISLASILEDQLFTAFFAMFVKLDTPRLNESHPSLVPSFTLRLKDSCLFTFKFRFVNQHNFLSYFFTQINPSTKSRLIRSRVASSVWALAK